jgi:hypothetical protein
MMHSFRRVAGQPAWPNGQRPARPRLRSSECLFSCDATFTALSAGCVPRLTFSFSCLSNHSGKALAGKVLEQQKRIADLQRKLSAAEKAESTSQRAPLITKSSKATFAASGKH